MTELLAPAGNMKALKAAIANGCNAIYLAATKFGARAYASNFTTEELQEAITYAHLRNVKIYITMNTILFEHELQEAYTQIDLLNSLYVDGIIIQDLALMNYIKLKYPNIEIHISTQMGIDDIYGVKLMEQLNVHRVVLSRELSLKEISFIKENSKMPLEVFVHGALCVGYSGNCLMSGLIGFRSGNRGRCVGSCRKEYTLINNTLNTKLDKSYLLSMKDLKTIDYVDELQNIDSLKIEGRMKEASYVFNVIGSYKNALEKKQDITTLNFNLEKTFHRTFTKGYLFSENIKNITNIKKPNNHGYYVGYISNKINNKYELTLSKTLHQNDHIRIDNQNEEVNLKVVKLYDAKANLINKSNNKCYLELKEKLNISDKVYITSDYNFLKEIESSDYNATYSKYPLDIKITGSIGSNLKITVSSLNHSTSFTSSFILEKSINKPTTYDLVYKQLNKLNDTVYYLNKLELYINEEFFILPKDLNQIRRDSVTLLNELRLKRNYITLDNQFTYKNIPLQKQSNTQISCFCNTLEQYQAAKSANIDIIYYNNIIRRNASVYKDIQGEVLVGGLNGVKYYENNNDIVTDFSLNVTNSESLYTLFALGVKRVTLSHELNKTQIDDLINSYYKKTNNYPNLEMIIYGKADLMFTKYCILKRLDMCADCKKYKFSIKDDYESFDLLFSSDCYTTILNSKKLNLIDEVNKMKNINVFRLQFTTENFEETTNVINILKNKLYNNDDTISFNESTDTRGHYNKEIL